MHGDEDQICTELCRLLMAGWLDRSEIWRLQVQAHQPETRALVASLAIPLADTEFVQSLYGLLTLRVYALKGTVSAEYMQKHLCQFRDAQLQVYQQRLILCMAAEISIKQTPDLLYDLPVWPSMKFVAYHSEPYYMYYRLRRQLVPPPPSITKAVRQLPMEPCEALFGGRVHAHRHLVQVLVDPDDTTVNENLAHFIVRWANHEYLFDVVPEFIVGLDVSLPVALLFLTVSHCDRVHDKLEESIVRYCPRTHDVGRRIRQFLRFCDRHYPVLKIFVDSILPADLDVSHLTSLAC